ncbi:MAG: DedA family protein [Gemmatimonadota bacterium]|nr:MAG: DedA family protein [Gemmatimonadota bacterium]
MLAGLLLSIVAGLPDAWLIDQGTVEQILEQLSGIESQWVYLALGVGVVIENFFPPLPADTFVAFGALLTARGQVTGTSVFLVTWTMNTAGALLNYGLARHWGRAVLATKAGRWVLRPRQLEKLAALYNAHGSKIIFASRFLPAFRALVPVFAGITHLALWRTALPIAAASAIWYGVLVYLGAAFGRNWQAILDALTNVNALLLVIAAALGGLLAYLWWKTRHHPLDSVNSEGGEW